MVSSNEVKIVQYADDTTFFLDGSRSTFLTLISILNKFSAASGLKINFAKSYLFPLGPYTNNPPRHVKDLDLTISNGPIKLLGIFFSHNGDELFRLNYVQKLSRLKNQLKILNTRDITPIGRNIIVKSFAVSQLAYLFQVLPTPPDYFMKEIQDVIFDFIWNGKPDKVKRSTMSNNIDKGGLKVIDVKSFSQALKISWVKRYLNDYNTGYWKLFFDLSLSEFGQKLLFR